MRSTVTDEQIIETYLRLKAGLKVAAALNIGEQTVYGVLQRHGIPRTGLAEYRQRIKKFDAESSQTVIKDYQNGMSALQVAKKHECSTVTILQLLRAAGIKVRRTQAQMKLRPDEYKQIKLLYQSGLSMKKVGEATGRTEVTVRRALRRVFPELLKPEIGPGSPHWRGGRRKDKNGYIYVWLAPDDPMFGMKGNGKERSSYVYEHRLVMARKIGRPLLATETVHHVNGDRADNRPENLELRQGKHGKHVVMCCLDCGSHNIGHSNLS